MSRAERLRWRIARVVGQLPGQCWAGLAGWVYDRPEGRRRGLPWEPISGRACRADAARTGACYCGKIRRDGTA
jgi:hypothetical protein